MIDQRAKSAFTRFVWVNVHPDVKCAPTALDYREAIAFTVVDMLEMGCDPQTIHELANWYRVEMGLPKVHVAHL